MKRGIYLYTLLLPCLFAFHLSGQEVTGTLSAKPGSAVDNSNALSSIPAPVGSSLPATCSVGSFYFNSTAAAGQNWYGCTSTNHWTLEGGAGTAGPGYQATSTTSLAIGTGSTSFTTQSGLAYTAGSLSYALICSSGSPTACFYGSITSYSGTTLVVNVTATTGSGTHADWSISVSGAVGPTGATGSTGAAGSNGTNGTNGTNGAGYTATSTTSLTIGTGSTSFTTQSGLAYTAGARARASYATTSTDYMEGLVTSYSGTTLVINVDTVGGSGTFASWNINVAGNVGATGAAGSTGMTGAAGTNGTNGTNGAISKIYNSGTALPVEPYLNFVNGGCVDNSGATRTDCTVSGSGSGFNGLNAQTITYTDVSGDNGKLVTMNGTSLTNTLPASPPSGTWTVSIENLNSSALSVSGNGLQINGSTTPISLSQYQQILIWTNGSNYFTGTPLICGSGVTCTPSSSGMTVAADTAYIESKACAEQGCSTSLTFTRSAASTYVATGNPTFAAYTQNQVLSFTFPHNCDGSDTVNLDGLGPIGVYKVTTGNIIIADVAGDCTIGVPFDARYTTQGFTTGGSPVSQAFVIEPPGGGNSVSIQSIGTSNSNQSLLDFIASVTNAIGLVATPSNPSGGQEKFEITGTLSAGAIAAPTSSLLGGVKSVTCPGAEFLDAVDTTGTPQCGTPAGGGGSSGNPGLPFLTPAPGNPLPVIQQTPGGTQALGGVFSGNLSTGPTFNGVFYVTGKYPYQTLAATYNTAVASGLQAFTIVDYLLSFTTPEVMYCTPWINDGTETISFRIELGPGILDFNNHTSSGAACPANQATFSAPKSSIVNGVDGGHVYPSTTPTAGTIIRAGSMWSTTAVGSAAYVSAGVATNCTTSGTCMMPLGVAGDWMGTSYLQGAQLMNLTLDCNYKPGCIGAEVTIAQELSGLWFVQPKNATQAIYYHGNLAQNSWMFQIADGGCVSAANGECLIDSTTNRVEWDNIPDSHGIVAGGTFNPVNTYNWAASGFTQTGGGPYTVTVTVASTTLGNPSAPGTITHGGAAGSTTYAYELVALQTFSKPTAASSATTTTTGNATLSLTNTNVFPTTALTGAYWGKVYRQTGGTGSYCYVANVVLGQSFTDIGYPASAQDCTPSASNQTGIAANDWVSLSGFTSNSPQAVVEVLSSPAPTATTFAFTSATSLTTSAGNVALVPAREINLCVGTSCKDGGPAEPMFAPLTGVHLEHCGYCVSIDPNSTTAISLKYADLTTSVSQNNDDVGVLVQIPAIAIKALTGGALHGATTTSLYQDLNKGYTIPSSTNYDSGESYGINGTQIPYAATITPTYVTTSFSATPTFTANSSIATTFLITLTGNVTSSTFAGGVQGQQVIFKICQDGTGSRTFAFPSSAHGAMTIGSTASECSVQPFVWDGAALYAMSLGVTNQ